MIAKIKEKHMETAYTLIDARKIIKQEKLYYIKQKLCGLLLIIIGTIIPIVLDGDATASLFFIPIGLFALLTRQHVICFKTNG